MIFKGAFRRLVRHYYSVVALSLFAVAPFFASWIAPSASAFGLINSSFALDTAPTVKFDGLRHYARLSGQAPVTVVATDDVGVARVELYLENSMLSSVNVVPNLPTVVVPFVWDSRLTANGKHILVAKAYDAEGNWQSISIVLVSQNFDGATPTPTVTPTPTPTATPSATPTPPTGNNITVNPATVYQTMSGWEITSEAGQFYSPAWNNYKASLLDKTVNDLGINRIRAEIKSGIENPTDYFAQWRAGQISESQYNAKRYEIINDNADPNTINPNGFKWSSLDAIFDELVIPLRQRLAARGETLWVSVCYVDFGSSAFEHKNNPAEYAEFVAAAYQHIQARYGFAPDSWEVILEPDNPAAAWSATQVAQGLKAAGDRLVVAGQTPRFIAPSTTSAAEAPGYIDQIAQTSGAMSYVSEFSYHRYCCATTSVLQAIASRATQYNKRAGMLEWIGADQNTISEDLKVANASSWQQFTLAGLLSWGPDSGGSYYLIDDTDASNPIIITGSKTKFLRQYFKYVRAGAKRIQAMTGNPGYDPVAFVNTNGKFVVVVKTGAPASFNLNGLPAGTYGIKYTTWGEYDANLPDITVANGQPVPVSIPAEGVVTIYAR